jgi:exonuclease VII small subunit
MVTIKEAMLMYYEAQLKNVVKRLESGEMDVEQAFLLEKQFENEIEALRREIAEEKKKK